jgi:hypothetical protein
LTRRLVGCLVTLVVLVCGLVGCGGGEPERQYSFPLDQAELDGPETLGLAASGQPVKGLIVYFHGSDQTARVILDHQKYRDFFDPLLRDGYAVVAADADGNAYGNPESLEDYRRLVTAAQKKYGDQPLFFVSESMGTLAALGLISEDTDRQVKALTGISPLMGLPKDIRSVPFVRGPWAGVIPDSADPLSWPPATLADRSFRLYVASEDKVIPANAGAKAFAAHFGSVAKIELINCVGDHVAADCYRGDDVKQWFASFK